MRIKTRLLRRQVPRKRPVVGAVFAHGRATVGSVRLLRRLAKASLARRIRAGKWPFARNRAVASLDFHVIGWGG